VTRECQARFYERRRVKLPPPTHHRLKTFGGWKLKLDADGACTWTSPAGLQYVTRPPTPGGISPPTEALQPPTIPSRKTMLRNLTGLPTHNTSSAAGEPPF